MSQFALESSGRAGRRARIRIYPIVQTLSLTLLEDSSSCKKTQERSEIQLQKKEKRQEKDLSHVKEDKRIHLGDNRRDIDDDARRRSEKHLRLLLFLF
tara:strand:- start:2083 stop:2376 length:294 start_codon:yes stop_codon:yes gene_type:complete